MLYSCKIAIAKMLHTCWSIKKGKVAYYILASSYSSHLNDIASISFLSAGQNLVKSAMGKTFDYWRNNSLLT